MHLQIFQGTPVRTSVRRFGLWSKSCAVCARADPKSTKRIYIRLLKEQEIPQRVQVRDYAFADEDLTLYLDQSGARSHPRALMFLSYEDYVYWKMFILWRKSVTDGEEAEEAPSQAAGRMREIIFSQKILELWRWGEGIIMENLVFPVAEKDTLMFRPLAEGRTYPVEKAKKSSNHCATREYLNTQMYLAGNWAPTRKAALKNAGLEDITRCDKRRDVVHIAYFGDFYRYGPEYGSSVMDSGCERENPLCLCECSYAEEVTVGDFVLRCDRFCRSKFRTFDAMKKYLAWYLEVTSGNLEVRLKHLPRFLHLDKALASDLAPGSSGEGPDVGDIDGEELILYVQEALGLVFTNAVFDEEDVHAGGEPPAMFTYLGIDYRIVIRAQPAFSWRRWLELCAQQALPTEEDLGDYLSFLLEGVIGSHHLANHIMEEIWWRKGPSVMDKDPRWGCATAMQMQARECTRKYEEFIARIKNDNGVRMREFRPEFSLLEVSAKRVTLMHRCARELLIFEVTDVFLFLESAGAPWAVLERVLGWATRPLMKNHKITDHLITSICLNGDFLDAWAVDDGVATLLSFFAHKPRGIRYTTSSLARLQTRSIHERSPEVFHVLWELLISQVPPRHFYPRLFGYQCAAWKALAKKGELMDKGSEDRQIGANIYSDMLGSGSLRALASEERSANPAYLFVKEALPSLEGGAFPKIRQTRFLFEAISLFAGSPSFIRDKVFYFPEQIALRRLLSKTAVVINLLLGTLAKACAASDEERRGPAKLVAETIALNKQVLLNQRYLLRLLFSSVASFHLGDAWTTKEEVEDKMRGSRLAQRLIWMLVSVDILVSLPSTPWVEAVGKHLPSGASNEPSDGALDRFLLHVIKTGGAVSVDGSPELAARLVREYFRVGGAKPAKASSLVALRKKK